MIEDKEVVEFKMCYICKIYYTGTKLIKNKRYCYYCAKDKAPYKKRKKKNRRKTWVRM